MKITYSDGEPSLEVCDLDAALFAIADRFDVSIDSLVTDDSGDRTLVWLDEESAIDDDGSHAVAQITGSPEPQDAWEKQVAADSDAGKLDHLLADYQAGSVSLGKTVELSGLSRKDFEALMKERGIERNYDAEEVQRDLDSAESAEEKEPLRIDREDLQGDFVTPPENQGQIVDVSYACTEDYIIERTHDRSDGEITLLAYRYDADDDEDWHPWSEAPTLGALVGPCVIVD